MPIMPPAALSTTVSVTDTFKTFWISFPMSITAINITINIPIKLTHFEIDGLSTFAVILIGKLIQKVLNVSVTLTVVDRAEGGVIGMAKGIIILSIVILFLYAIPFTRDYIPKSFIARHIVILNKKLTGASPIEFVKELRGSVNIDRFISSSNEIFKHSDEISDTDRKKLDEIIKERIEGSRD